MRRTFASFAKTGSKASGPAKTFGAVARLSAPLEGNVVSQCYTRARFAETIESSRKSVVEERLLNANSAASSMMATPVSGRAVPQSLVAASATNVRSVDSERSPSTFSSVMPLSLGMVVASSLRPVSLISDVTTVEGSASASTSSSSPSLPPSVSVSSSPLTLESNILEQHARGQLDGIYELCAVPKKRTSRFKARLRREGQWRQKAKHLLKPYRICVGCGKPVEPAFMCKTDLKCLTYPRV